jgi:heterotetrameric sarcosine oxidase gamma subunit
MGVRILQLTPYEWLAISDAVDGPALHRHLWSDLGEQEIGAIDVSHRMRALRIEGAAAQGVLTRAASVDFWQFSVGHACRARLAQLLVTIDYLDPLPRFELYVDRSHLPQLRSCLQGFPDAQ